MENLKYRTMDVFRYAYQGYGLYLLSHLLLAK